MIAKIGKVNWNNSYNDVVQFETLDAKESYFDTHLNKLIIPNPIIKPTTQNQAIISFNVLEYNKYFESIIEFQKLDLNYLMLQSEDDLLKRTYYFITGANLISGNRIALICEIDAFQTFAPLWKHVITNNNWFVERMHVDRLKADGENYVIDYTNQYLRTPEQITSSEKYSYSSEQLSAVDIDVKANASAKLKATQTYNGNALFLYFATTKLNGKEFRTKMINESNSTRIQLPYAIFCIPIENYGNLATRLNGTGLPDSWSTQYEFSFIKKIIDDTATVNMWVSRTPPFFNELPPYVSVSTFVSYLTFPEYAFSTLEDDEQRLLATAPFAPDDNQKVIFLPLVMPQQYNCRYVVNFPYYAVDDNDISTKNYDPKVVGMQFLDLNLTSAVSSPIKLQQQKLLKQSDYPKHYIDFKVIHYLDAEQRRIQVIPLMTNETFDTPLEQCKNFLSKQFLDIIDNTNLTTSVDKLKDYLENNKNAIGQSIFNGIGTTAIGGAIGGAIRGGGVGSAIGLAGGLAKGGADLINTAFTIDNLRGAPDTVKLSGSNFQVNFKTGIRPFINVMLVREEFRQQLYQLTAQRGYTINNYINASTLNFVWNDSLALPTRPKRYYWYEYIQTRNLDAFRHLPLYAQQIINNAFDNGVRVWYYSDTVEQNKIAMDLYVGNEQTPLMA